MLARSALRSAARVAAGRSRHLPALFPQVVNFYVRIVAARPTLIPQVRFMGGDHHHHDDTPKFTLNKDGVAIPELVDSLEWLLDAPPNVHQFEEPPVS